MRFIVELFAGMSYETSTFKIEHYYLKSTKYFYIIKHHIMYVGRLLQSVSTIMA